jgi:hypothetical protein
VAELEKFPFGERFQLVVDVGCLHGLSGRADLLRGYAEGLAHWTAPFGCFLLYAHEPGGEGGVVHGLSRQAVEELFAGNFRLLEYHPGKEGSWQSAWYRFFRI